MRPVGKLKFKKNVKIVNYCYQVAFFAYLFQWKNLCVENNFNSTFKIAAKSF